MTILVAEDEKPMSKALSIKFEKSGFEVTVVSNGEEALKQLREKQFSIVLLDIMMPIMNGFEVLEAMRNEQISATVIVSTNLSQDDDYKKAEGYGVAGYVVKSNTPISDIVKLVLEKVKDKEQKI